MKPFFSMVCITSSEIPISGEMIKKYKQPKRINGYKPIALGADYRPKPSDIVYDGYPGWRATGKWSANVTGVAICVNGCVVRSIKLTQPFIAHSGKKLAIVG